jgi:hypothetical protein
MRTTLDIEDDILFAAKELARERGGSIGKIISDLARQTLTRKPHPAEKDGIPHFPVQPNAGVVTLEIVNRLRDETK